MKKILGIYSSSRQHCIGAGLQARTLFSQRTLGCHVSPFLSLDLVTSLAASAAPVSASASATPQAASSAQTCKRLTLVRQGQVDYVDASGKRCRLNAGDVQWNLLPAVCRNSPEAGTFHAAGANSQDPFELLQLWIDWPASHGDAPCQRVVPAQALLHQDLPGDGGRMRMIAGESPPGAALAAASLSIREVSMRSRSLTECSCIEGHTLLLVVLSGSLRINGDQTAAGGEVVMFGHGGSRLYLESSGNSQALLLSGAHTM